MVTRTKPARAAVPRVPAGSVRAGTPRRWLPALARTAVLAVLLGALLGLGARPAAAQASTLYFLTFKRGASEGGNGETLFKTLEAAHGPKQGSRSVRTHSVELDIYGVSGAHTGLGVGLEILGYDHAWVLADGVEKIHMRGKGVLFTFKTFLRLGPVFPFFGFGLGNYYVNYDEAPNGPSLRDSPDSVSNVRVGVRILMGRIGLLWEMGNTRAQLPILISTGQRETLELGGPYSNVGLSWMF